MANLDEYVTRHLLNRGLSPREVKASTDKIPAEIQRVIPKDILATLVEGRIPATGFGLGGKTGGGKTMALSAILRKAAEAQTRAYVPTEGHQFPGPLKGLWWASWPDEVSWLRSHALDPDANERIERMCEAKLLVLDDLGRERIKGSYVEDWAASQLDSIINHRYRAELPILWTTNITEAELLSLYGAAMLRRLTADNPPCWIANLKVMK